MRGLLNWLWARGIVSTFVSGWFAILPIVITVAIVGWVIGYLHAMLGPETVVGSTMQSIGLRLVGERYDEQTRRVIASVVGWSLVLVGIWLIGLLVKSNLRQQYEAILKAIIERIPVVKAIYGTVVQVVGMLDREGQSDTKGMSVVYCSFGEHNGAGFLALLASSKTYHFRGQDCAIVYIPTSPVPMSGGIIFVPTHAVTKVDMTVDNLMQIYLSLGVLAPQSVPADYQAATSQASD